MPYRQAERDLLNFITNSGALRWRANLRPSKTIYEILESRHNLLGAVFKEQAYPVNAIIFFALGLQPYSAAGNTIRKGICSDKLKTAVTGFLKHQAIVVVGKVNIHHCTANAEIKNLAFIVYRSKGVFRNKHTEPCWNGDGHAVKSALFLTLRH